MRMEFRRNHAFFGKSGRQMIFLEASWEIRPPIFLHEASGNQAANYFKIMPPVFLHEASWEIMITLDATRKGLLKPEES